LHLLHFSQLHGPALFPLSSAAVAAAAAAAADDDDDDALSIFVMRRGDVRQ
jgi:hypothetical protein